jgi:hypothetical protein
MLQRNIRFRALLIFAKFGECLANLVIRERNFEGRASDDWLQSATAAGEPAARMLAGIVPRPLISGIDALLEVRWHGSRVG